jgi:head-tail adaptor
MGNLIHPGMLERLSRFFPLIATIEQRSVTQDEYGQAHESWTTLPAHEAIPCTRAPLSASERATLELQITTQAWHLLLRGAYPDITTEHRVVLSGEPYDILAVETDQTGTLTRLTVQRVSV